MTVSATTFPDYPQTRKERVWVKPETTFNTLIQPDVVSAFIPLPGMAIPPIYREYTPSIERNPSAGVRQLIRRKKKAQSWTVPVYLKIGSAGLPPSWTTLLKYGMGTITQSARDSFTTALAGANNDIVWTAQLGGTTGITIQYIDPGAPSQSLSIDVTSGVNVRVHLATDGGSVITTTAQQILDYLISGNASAAALLVTAALATGNDGTGLVIALSVQSLTGGATGSVTYSGATAIEQTSFSLWHFVDNAMRGFRGCLTNQIVFDVSGSDEGKIVFTGWALNEVFAGTSTLTGNINNSVTTVNVTNPRRYQVGPAASDFIYLQIADEIVKLTAVNYTSGDLTITRGQLGSTAVTHSTGDTIGPWVPGQDPDPVDIIEPLTIGTFVPGSLANLRAITYSLTYNNNIQPREDEYGQDVGTGYRRTAQRQVTGKVTAYARQNIQDLRTNLDRDIRESWVVTAGDGTSTFNGVLTPKMTITTPLTKITREVLNSGGPEFILEWDFQCLESSVGNDEVSVVLT